MSRRDQRSDQAPLSASAAGHPTTTAAVIVRHARQPDETPSPDRQGVCDPPMAMKRGGGVQQVDGKKPRRRRLDRPQRRRRHFDEGGEVPTPSRMTPYSSRIDAYDMSRPGVGGVLASEIPGRGERVPYTPAADSDVPSVIVIAGLGEGNLARTTDAAMDSAPYGTRPSRARGTDRSIPRPPPEFHEPPQPDIREPFPGYPGFAGYPEFTSGGRAKAKKSKAKR